MKRYNIAHRFVDGLGVDEDPNGDWVRWEDIEPWLYAIETEQAKAIKNQEKTHPCGCLPIDDIEIRGKNQCGCGFRR